MNVYLHELKACRKSCIVWTCTLVVMLFFYLSLFSSFFKDAVDAQKLLQGYPDAVKKALGLNVMEMASLVRFYSFIFGYIVLCGAIQAMNLGTSILSKELREKTADFLLTKPITRSSILTAKLLAAVTSLVITNMVYIICAIIAANIFKTEDYNITVFLMISATMFFVQILFLVIGIFLSIILGKIKSVISVSLGTVFTFYFISMFTSVLGDNSLRYITPFQYFNSSYIIEHSSYEGSFIAVGIVVVILTVTASYLMYVRKDIHAV
ncbi:ABC transporter permease subunit [Ectobacillus polymachus]|uniref:ABC transporter permease subunit n=1 Tax=Ectobacillus polymachus TaxID=1508806 RepID=UPI003A836727